MCFRDNYLEWGWPTCVISLVIVSLIILKLYLKLTVGFHKGNERMDGKVVIITGANGGIGKETAKDLAIRGARVILACRNLESANAVRDEIVAVSGNHDVVVHELDLASLASVRDFAQRIIKSEKKIDVLVNNAGVAGLEGRTRDGLQTTMQINLYGPFLLTTLLVDLMKKSAPSRIIFVSSMFHHLVNLTLDNLDTSNTYVLYSRSKLAIILMANEFARRLDGTGVTVNSLHPGGTASDIFREMYTHNRVLTNLFVSCFYKNCYEGAQTTIYLAVSKDVENVTGKYFVDCQEARKSTAARDMVMARNLWNKVENLVKNK